MKPPALAELFQHYLRNQAEAQALGLGYAEPTGDVVPHDAVPVQPIDPRQAWADALAVLDYFPNLPKAQFAVPPDWPSLVSNQESTAALAFCLGNTPQLVRNLQPLLEGDLAALRILSGTSEPAGSLEEWAATLGDGPPRLLAAGVLRLARHFASAAKCLQSRQSDAWTGVQANEQAALLWHQGKAEEAAAAWQNQAATPPVLFNRGMAALFLGDRSAARASLAAAVAALPETSPWHHLGRLYLALAGG
jgi:hypothetical protein